MTNEQKGAYLTLLIENWSAHDFALPARVDALRELANWTGSVKDFTLVRACFVEHPEQPGKLHNPRLYKEWKKAEEKRLAAKASAQIRWSKPAVPELARKPHDRSGKGFTKVGSEIQAVADKHFPPI